MEKFEHFLAWTATSLLGLLVVITKILFKDIYQKLDNLAKTNQELLSLLNTIDKRITINEPNDPATVAKLNELLSQPSSRTKRKPS
jgi:hypothetical protein